MSTAEYLANLRRDLALLGLSAVIGATAIWVAWQHHGAAQADALQARLLAERLGARVADFERERAQILAGADVHQRLSEQGMFGSDSRSRWRARIDAVTTARQLPAAIFTFLGPAAPATELGASGSPLRVLASQMLLHIDVVHEQDLFGLFHDLESGLAALPLIRQCQVAPLPSAGTDTTAPTPRLRVECRLSWLTIADAD